MRRLGAAAVLLVLTAAPSAAPRSDSYMQRLKDAEASLATLLVNAWDTTRSPEKSAALRPFIRALHSPGTERAFAGDIAGAIVAYDAADRARSARPFENPAEASIADEASVEDALQAIVAQARTRRVLLINDGHNMPMHRTFSQRLARELRKIAYTYLACETFDSNSPTACSGVYVGHRGGYYTRGPGFGTWVAQAIADAWKLVGYEAGVPAAAMSREQRIIEREAEQALNLVGRIFAQDKDAKVLIHVGYDRLDKGSAKTGLDMLHVDQTRFYAHPDPVDDSPLYASMLAKANAVGPFVLKSKQGEYAVLAGQTGRVGLLPSSGRRAVLAYRAGEPVDAVPADVVLAEAGTPVPKLLLPAGEYRFAVEE